MDEQGEKGYVVKGDVKEVEEGMLRRMRVNARIHCCGRKVADLNIYLFFLLPKRTEWALVYSPETRCLHLHVAVYTVQWNWICRRGRYFMAEPPYNQPCILNNC